MTSVLGAAVLLGGCPANPIPCCEASGHGAVGRYGTCDCPGSCEYGYFWGDVPCTDDPSGHACVLWTGSPTFGTNVRCFDPGGPTGEFRCCEDIGADGIGRLATCRCPISGDCVWSPNRVIVDALPDGACRVHERVYPAAPIDAGRRDTGATIGMLECGGVPCEER